MTETKRRKFTRLPEYDYSSPGEYFITICTNKKVALFGTINNGQCILNVIGKVAEKYLVATSNHFPGTDIDCYSIMPNHVHAIIMIADPESQLVGATHASPLPSDHKGRGPAPASLSAIVGSYKSAVSRQIGNSITSPLWQRGYYDHIVRNGSELQTIREYISNNPAQWELDRFYSSTD